MNTTSVALAIAGITLGGCAASSPKPAPIPIIDAHIHARFPGTPERTSKIKQSQDELLREMRQAGVVGAISHAPADGDDSGYVDLSAHGVIHCAGVGEKIDVARLDEGLRTKKYRCLKIYLGYVHRFAADAAYRPVYELAKKHGVPVVFHTGDTYSTKAKLKFADPLTVDEVAVDFPQVTFVIAHCGNPWIESAAEVAYKNPNVYLDGSAFLIGNLEAMSPAKIDELVVRPLGWIFRFVEDPTKLMFGTDWPLTHMAPYVAAFKKAIPQEHWRAVFHDNAVRVFKLK